MDVERDRFGKVGWSTPNGMVKNGSRSLCLEKIKFGTRMMPYRF